MSFDISKLVDEWKQDSVMRDTKVVEELLKTPNLHAKYLEMYLFCKAKVASSESAYNRMKNAKRRYYRGEMDLPELQQRQWDQYQGLKMSASEFNGMAEIDLDLIALKEKVDFWKSNIQILEYIMKQISSRDWALKSIIDYKKFEAGG